MRIALTISGAVSLGAFEGGALAALISGVQACQEQCGDKPPPLRIDAIGAASAGSITAVLAARALSGGLDPVWVMEQAWVRESQLGTFLRHAGLAAPLGMNGLEAMAARILKASPERIHRSRVQQCQVDLHLALTNLRGLDYNIPSLANGEPAADRIRASTYLDWGTFTIDPGAEPAAFTEPAGRSAVATALASGANEFGFPPKSLARTKKDYANQGLVNFPDAASSFWYTDGGTIDNEPLGRTMDLANDIDARHPLRHERRVHVLIHPFPSAPPPPSSLAWADVKKRPSWVRTFVRAVTIIRAQNLFEDLRRAQKVNSQLVGSGRLQEAVEELFGGMSSVDRERWRGKLAELLEGIENDLSRVPRHRKRPAAELETSPSAADLFRRVLERVSGLSGKKAVGIDVISPYLARGTTGLPLRRLLAGELLQSFGGFLDEGLRRSDFALGYVCMLNWMHAGLRKYGLAKHDCQLAVDASLQAFYELPTWPAKKGKGFTAYGLTQQLLARAEALGLPSAESWVPTYFGDMGLGNLSLRAKAQLARVAVRVLAIGVLDAWRMATRRDQPPSDP